MNKPLESPFINSHWFFGGSILIASTCFHLLSSPYLAWVYCVIFFSLLLDWMSAYEEREKTDMVLFLFNLFAVFNYVSMFVAMTLSTGTYSGLYILVHYILIFVNYVLWNVYIAKKINSQKEKQFLISLSVVQIFTVVGFILSVLGVLPFFDITYSDIISYLTSNTSDVLRNSLFFLSIFHITIMIFWVSKKYKIRQTENLSPITSQGMTQSKNKNKVNAK